MKVYSCAAKMAAVPVSAAKMAAVPVVCTNHPSLSEFPTKSRAHAVGATLPEGRPYRFLQLSRGNYLWADARQSRMDMPKRRLKSAFGGAGFSQPQAAVIAAIGSSVLRRSRFTSSRRMRSIAS